jgi:hypothetical protein
VSKSAIRVRFRDSARTLHGGALDGLCVLAEKDDRKLLRLGHAPELAQSRDASCAPLGDELSIARHVLIEPSQSCSAVAPFERRLHGGEQSDLLA